MRIRCWGARGTVPVADENMSYYGGATPCLEVRTAEQSVIVCDAGTGIRALGQSLMAEEVRHITLLLSHGHDDHLHGLPFFEPLYSSETVLTVFEHDRLRMLLEGLCDAATARRFSPLCMRPVEAQLEWRSPLQSGDVASVGSAYVMSIPASHPGGAYGFKITDRGRSVVYLPDNELDVLHEGGVSFEQYCAVCHGADLLIHDAQFTCSEYDDCKGWGHSSWRRALDLAVESGVQQLGLFHHEPDRTDAALADIVQQCKREAGKRSPRLVCFAMREGTEIVLT